MDGGDYNIPFAFLKKRGDNKNNMNDPQKKYRLRTVSKNILLEGLNLTLRSDVDQDT